MKYLLQKNNWLNWNKMLVSLALASNILDQEQDTTFDDDEDHGLTSDQISFNALKDVKQLEWGKEDTDDQTILDTRQKIIDLLKEIASNHPEKSIRKKIGTNVKNLTKHITRRFKLEGTPCPCANDSCYRNVYSVQLSYLGHTTNSLVSQKARCFDAAKDLYDVANVDLNAKVSPLLTFPFNNSLTLLLKGRGDCLFFLWGFSKQLFTLLLLENY
jgi:hypothetical protein